MAKPPFGNNTKKLILIAIGVSFAVVLGLGLVFALLPKDKTFANDMEHAISLMKDNPLIDGHNDLPWQYRERVFTQVSQVFSHMFCLRCVLPSLANIHVLVHLIFELTGHIDRPELSAQVSSRNKRKVRVQARRTCLQV